VFKSQQDTRAIQRYLIKRVDDGSYTTDRGHVMSEKVSAALQDVTLLKADEVIGATS
jgi:DNA replication ATP-dependent helicase Dna2